MIDPTEKDVGRKVIYVGQHDGPKHGVITSFNERFVFVRYEENVPNGTATHRDDLEWLYPNSEGPNSARCPECGKPVENFFDHVDIDCRGEA